MNKALNMAVNIAGQLHNTINHYGPVEWKIYLQVLQLNACTYIIESIIIGTVFTIISIYFWKWTINLYEKNSYYAPECGTGIIAVITSCVALGCLIALAINPWWFITAFNPQLGAAHDIVTALQAKINS